MKKIILTVLLILCTVFSATCYASSIKVTINNKVITFDEKPFIQNGRTLVPMRKIFEEFGCDVEWLEESQTIIATKNNQLFVLQIDKCKILCMDVSSSETVVYETDVPPAIHNGRTMIPVRAVSELLGCKVEWDDENQTVVITTE